MFCSKCGAQLQEGSLRCPGCLAVVHIRPGSVVQTPAPAVKSAPQKTPTAAEQEEYDRQTRALQAFWPEWTVAEKLFSDSFGTVYKAERRELNTVSYAAIKVIRIPQNNDEALSLSAEMGLNDVSAAAYFKSFVQDCVNEIKTMESLKGTPNIVSVEDYKVIENSTGFGWTVYIRTELLPLFSSTVPAHGLDAQEAIRLGIDICSALEACENNGILHLDIKPANVFLSDSHIYKLGNFGIARKLEKCAMGMPKTGICHYTAPEVYSGQTAGDCRADVYSLGIMLYKLLNNNRYPLLDPTDESITYQQTLEAFEKRMNGADLPDPVNADRQLGAVIRTACAFRPEDRFLNATAMKNALLTLQAGDSAPAPVKRDRAAEWAAAEKSLKASAAAAQDTSVEPFLPVQPEPCYAPNAPYYGPAEPYAAPMQPIPEPYYPEPAPMNQPYPAQPAPEPYCPEPAPTDQPYPAQLAPAPAPKEEKKNPSKRKKMLVILLAILAAALLIAGGVWLWHHSDESREAPAAEEMCIDCPAAVKI